MPARTPDVPPPASGRRATTTWLAGLVLCVVPAAFLAACSLANGDDEAAPPPDSLTVVDDPPAEPAPTAGSTAPSPDEEPTTTDAPTSSVTDTADPPTSSAADEPDTTDAPTPSATDEPDATDAPASDGTDATAPVSFATQVEPIIERSCANCHTGQGPGTPHVRMDDAGLVARSAAGLSFVVESGFMPPWPAGGDSVAFQHDWSLTDDEIATLLAWDEAGSPLDVPDDHVIEPSTGDGVRITDPDVEMRSRGTYDGTAGQPDEYRCFVHEPAFAEGGYVTAMDFRPDQTEVVHHAVGFLLSAEDRADLDAVDGADGQGGWTCFGFSPGPSAELVYAWAPGQAANRYPEGTGLRVEAGDFFVMQTHYHFELDAPPDRSSFDIGFVGDSDPRAASMEEISLDVYLGPAEIPCAADETGPLCDRDAAIAAAIEKYGIAGRFADGILALCGQTPDDYADMTDGTASSTCDQRISSSGTIVGVFGHQHEIGASFRMTLHPDTPDEVVLLDIPRWDFDWQLLYEPVDDIVVEAGDVLRMECSWDRSLRDPELEPAYVIWSDGTDDEMCFASITTRP